MLSQADCEFVARICTAPFYKTADETSSLQGWQLLVPPLAAGTLGAAYGALQAPGGSPLRGGLVGGLAGAGAGAAFTGAHQALASPYGNLMNKSSPVNASLLLGAAGLGGAGGLRAGRQLSDWLGLPDKHKNDELSELDATHRGRHLLPKNLREYLGV